MRPIHHVDLVVSSLPRSLRFHLDLLGPLGRREGGRSTGERGEDVVHLARPGAGAVGLRERPAGAGQGAHDRHRLGLHHVAVEAPSRDAVDERAAWAGAAGANVGSPPGGYASTPGDDACCLHDPDGFKLEVVHQPDVEGDA